MRSAHIRDTEKVSWFMKVENVAKIVDASTHAPDKVRAHERSRFMVGNLILITLILGVLIPFLPSTSGVGVWWDNNWSHRKTITIDHTKVSGSLVNFPVLIDITDSNLQASA